MKEQLLESINKGFASVEILIKEYPFYPPILNSKVMLNDIRNNIGDIDYLKRNKDLLNIGLLAAKALDCEIENQNILSYSALLHNAWAEFLIIIGQSRPKHLTKRREKTAYDFYKNHYTLNGQPDDNKIYDHMLGIDFSCSVDVIKLKPGEIVCQWRAVNMSQGDYYAETKKATRPDCLGINEYQENYLGHISKRVRHRHKLVSSGSLAVLKSVAAGVIDTWSVKGTPQITSGGCLQYFNSDQSKFKQNYP